jgi:hypothetical protein
MMGEVFLGIDPGFTGYIVLIDDQGNYLERFKTPCIVEKKSIKRNKDKYNKKGKLVWKKGHISTKTSTVLDEEQIVEYLSNLIDRFSKINICIEKQHAITGQGLASTAKNMYGFGFWVGVSRALGFNTHVISAVDWQKEFSDESIEDKKEASIDSVTSWNKDICLKKTKRSKKADHNLADAINIARYTYLICK